MRDKRQGWGRCGQHLLPWTPYVFLQPCRSSLRLLGEVRSPQLGQPRPSAGLSYCTLSAGVSQCSLRAREQTFSVLLATWGLSSAVLRKAASGTMYVDKLGCVPELEKTSLWLDWAPGARGDLHVMDGNRTGK